jgi:hypothetical protein
MKHLKLSLVLSILLFATLCAWSDEQLKIAPVFSGYASFEESEIVKGYLNMQFSNYAGPVLTPLWMENAKMGLCANTDVGEHLQIIAAFEGKLGFSLTTDYNPQTNYSAAQQEHWDFTIQRGEGLYSFGDPQNPFLQIEAGYFPYKYNPDVRNLGEYLFRSFCYPAALLNTFDRPYADLLGLRIGNAIPLSDGSFHHDLLFTSETKHYPLKDFSLSYVTDYSISGIFSVGAGGSLYRLLPVFLNDSGTVKTPVNQYVDTTTGDTGYYTFSGIKLMARVSFDVKGIIPMDFLGKEDLKLYGELAILGLKNYPGFYDNLSERMPVMLGFNWFSNPLLSYPVAGIGALLFQKKINGASFLEAGTGIMSGVGLWLLEKYTGIKTGFDILSLELEYQGTRNPNGITKTYYQPYCPLPDDPIAGNPRTMLKWSLYANKKIGSHLSIIGQIANDHLMPDNYTTLPAYQPLTDVTLRANDWWWVVKALFYY